MNRQDFAREPQLWQIAETHFGAGLQPMLDEIFRTFPPLDDRNYVWRHVQLGPMIDRLQQVYTPGSKQPVVLREKRHVQADMMGLPERELRLMLLDEHRDWLFTALISRLPPELLPAALLERRLELDLGL
jgi:hypothetical protein